MYVCSIGDVVVITEDTNCFVLSLDDTDFLLYGALPKGSFISGLALFESKRGLPIVCCVLDKNAVLNGAFENISVDSGTDFEGLF